MSAFAHVCNARKCVSVCMMNCAYAIMNVYCACSHVCMYARLRMKNYVYAILMVYYHCAHVCRYDCAHVCIVKV